MRIDDLNRAPQSQPLQNAGETPGKKRADAVAPDEGDQAQISDLARVLSSADSKRVEQLKLEVQSGRYNVSAAEVAKAIIDAHSRE